MQIQDINLMQVGTVIVFIGMIVVMIGSLKASKSGSSDTGSGSTAKVAVGGFIGPFPFGFANDKNLMYFLIGLMVLAMIVWFVLINMHK
ncbi:MAG: DUF131 domain-containing protein [Candidatus Woesearchaeota archaeon]|nr:DUF131 domain-containing protein [Candidatus Woesearchaeota archaeon]